MNTFELKSPIRANMEITEACPLACKHCYTYWGYAATGEKKVASDEKYELGHFNAILDRLIDVGIRVLTLTGGEPFEKRDILFELAEKAKKNGMMVFVNTSGALISKSDMDTIRSLDLDGYLVSLMSCIEDTNDSLSQTNSYKKTIEGIKLLVSAGQNVSVNMVCSKENYKDVRETANFVADLGVNSFSAAPMMAALSYPGYLDLRLNNDELRETIDSLAWARENLPIMTTTLESLPYCAFSQQELKEYRPILSHSYCCAGMNDCAVSVRGDIRPCIMSSEVVGNILTDDWNIIWKNMARWRTVEILPEECRNCVVVDECGGGCRVSAKVVNGSYEANDPYMQGAINDPLENPDVEHYENKFEISLKTKLCVSDDVIVREETFGGTLFFGNRCLFLKKDPYQMFLRLREKDSFTMKELIAEYGLEKKDLKDFLSLLTEEGVIVII